jgi:hypothetical protein
VIEIAVQIDGRILIGGDFNTVAGSRARKLPGSILMVHSTQRSILGWALTSL